MAERLCVSVAHLEITKKEQNYMNKLRVFISTLAIAIFAFAFASMAQAQATRTWVSGVGDDLNPCSRTAPCKTWAGAISKTFIHGEIDALDPGGFGTVTITKSITLDGAGTFASILASGTNGININIAPGNSDDPFREVTIRGLSINGSGATGTIGTRTGIKGISIANNGAAIVQIEDSIIQSFSQNGIIILGSSAVNLNVNNTQIKNCTGAGISADTSAGIARVTMRNSSITNSGTGLNARRNSRVAMINSTVAFNTVGVFVEGNGGTAVAVLESCQIANNTGNGIQAGGGAATNNSVARLSNNIINNNGGSGVSIQANGSVESFLNNKIVGNNPDGCAGCVSLSADIN
jgi:hypothetical protein